MMNNKRFIVTVIIAICLMVVSACGTRSSSTPTVSSGKYKEPAQKPQGLPSSVKFNPDTNEYYDSSLAEWDSNAQTYRYIEPTLPPATPTPIGYIAPKISLATVDDWIKSHQDSKDPVDVALIKYLEAMPEYYENHPELSSSSSWEVGEEYGGPFSIITDLGIERLPQLLKYIDWQNPQGLLIPVELAVDRICRTSTGEICTSDVDIAKWKIIFNNKVATAKSNVDDIVQKLGKDSPVNDEEINNKFTELGVFALPSVYDEVVNKSNDQLVKYLPNILPDKQMNEFNLKTGAADNDTLKKALESCKDDVEVLKTLTVN